MKILSRKRSLFWKITLIFCGLFFYQSILFSQNFAVILMYHRVGDSRYPTTNVTMEQFSQEMAYLKNMNYHVLPLVEIVRRLQQGTALPEKTIGISFDDAYTSIFDNARPILKQYQFPYTLFIATAPIDGHYQDSMTWEQIKILQREGADIGNHSVYHSYLEHVPSVMVAKEIEMAKQRIKAELGVSPLLFAYPYGEYNKAMIDEVIKANFMAAFTQSSGAIGQQSDFYALPRFSLNEEYADFSRFKFIINVQPLPWVLLEPSDTVVHKTPEKIKIKISEGRFNLKNLSCYTSRGKKMSTVLEEKGVEILVQQPFIKGQNKINCTLHDHAGNWYWSSLLFLLV